jgi:hypothetical protein
MTVQFQMFGDEPYFIATFSAPFTVDDYKATMKTGLELSDRLKAKNLPHKIWSVRDVRTIKFTFDDVVNILDSLHRSDMNHILEGVVVGSAEMLEFGTKAAAQRQYGARHIELFSDLDTALAFVKKQINA